MSIGDLQFSNLCQQSTFFKRFTQSFMFDFGSQVVPNEGFLYFCISSIKCSENEAINVRYKILDSANILKIIIFSLSVIILILINLKYFAY